VEKFTLFYCKKASKIPKKPLKKLGLTRILPYIYSIRLRDMNRIKLLNQIKELSTKYQMVLDWNKIELQSDDELERILGMIERIYKLRVKK